MHINGKFMSETVSIQYELAYEPYIIGKIYESTL